ncbi:hypothetical protein NONO_c40260 [Nocardia nova SH22a]|uniref:Uncharacterized protein n=1 Tax=Nocardia nova SH22a TaxID=1415166 RepID=W5THH9_9NOCA|nr:hypothetical protein NONO_c40260 [Nocardia nova SH22a]
MTGLEQGIIVAVIALTLFGVSKYIQYRRKKSR